jgi:hypothetical protein
MTNQGWLDKTMNADLSSPIKCDQITQLLTMTSFTLKDVAYVGLVHLTN